MELYVILLVIVVIIVSYVLIHRRVIEFFSEYQKNRPGELSPFINFNLTDKPVANYAPFPIYQWWKSGPYRYKYEGCDQYRCQTPQYNGFNAQPGFSLVNGAYVDPVANQRPVLQLDAAKQCAYYHNSASYCAKNPQDTRCPDYWVYSKHI